MRLCKKLLLSGMTVLPCSFALGQESVDSKSCPFSFSASYIGDVVSNFSGGIKRGTTYLGLANISAEFDPAVVGWWRGGLARINACNTHGGMPTRDYVGDFQWISNIEAGNLTFMYELWYKQSIGQVDVKLGLQDLNSDFAVSDNGLMFNNSSFGIQSSISENISSPIFPLTALGINLRWQVSDSFLWQAAVFDGTPDDYESNQYNLHWQLSKNQGCFAVSEFQYNKGLIADRAGAYKLGLYYHEHRDSSSIVQFNHGAYAVIDQSITDKLSLFGQIGISPRKINSHNHYYGLGLNYKGLFDDRPDDVCGLALAYAKIDRNDIGSETAIELVYDFQLNKYMHIKPDLQYVINPAGTDVKLKNALVGMLRFQVEF